MLSECLAHWRSVGRRPVGALLVTAALIGVSCSSGADDATTSFDTSATTVSDRDEDFTAAGESTPVVSDPTDDVERASAVPDAELPISIIEIDFDAGMITIANHGRIEVDLDGVWLCEFPDYEPLDAATLAPGTSVTIPNPHDSSADDGELALYRTDDFDSSDAILSYVEWGTAGHTRSTVAVEAGVWGTDAVEAGLVLATGGSFAVDASDWSVLTTLSGERPAPPTSSPPAPASTRPPASGTTQPPSTTRVTTSAPAPPPDDYSPSTPATTSPSAPPPPPPPPDDYSPSAPATTSPSAPPPPPPPDEY